MKPRSPHGYGNGAAVEITTRFPPPLGNRADRHGARRPHRPGRTIPTFPQPPPHLVRGANNENVLRPQQEVITLSTAP